MADKDKKDKKEDMRNFRVLFQDEENNWDVKVCDSKQVVDSWMIGHPGSVLLRYVVVIDGGKLHYDTKEEAMAVAQEKNSPWSLLHPGKELSSEALAKAYAA